MVEAPSVIGATAPPLLKTLSFGIPSSVCLRLPVMMTEVAFPPLLSFLRSLLNTLFITLLGHFRTPPKTYSAH